MSFLGRIFYGFLYFDFHWVGGSPRPVSHTPKFVLLTLLFSFSFSWDVLPRMDFWFYLYLLLGWGLP